MEAAAQLSTSVIHTIDLRLSPKPGSLPDIYEKDYGFRIYYGIMPHGGASTEEAASTKHYLMQPPASGDELPLSFFTHRKRHRVTFDAHDRGKTAYFCVQYENSKGDKGIWSSVSDFIIT
jgi:hypothetical protein